MVSQTEHDQTFAPRVLEWFDQHGRHDLPWQYNRSPYRVWLSEIMLQQTQVATVIPYFMRFTERFPAVTDLAAASEDDVLHLWTGLGYYARARNLHRTAQHVVAAGGEFPDSVDGLMGLPGIGRSTAGAIASLAMGQRAAILDGNVKRVLARHDAIAGWPGTSTTLKALWSTAEAYTPGTRVADYNQAMMDLGATLCRRSKPACPGCPLATTCVARATQQQQAFPGRKARKPLPHRETCMLILQRNDGRVLLEKRPERGVWGGLWSFPETDGPGTLPGHLEGFTVHTEVADLEMPAIEHTFSHFHLRIRPIVKSVTAAPVGVAELDSTVWIDPAEEIYLGVAAPVGRLLRKLGRDPTESDNKD